MKILERLSARTFLIITEPFGPSIVTICGDGRTLLTPVNSGKNFEIQTVQNQASKSHVEFNGEIVAGTQGTLVKVFAKAGRSFDAGEVLCVIEVMKMSLEIRAPVKLQILEVMVQQGQAVNNKQILLKAQEVQ